MQDEVRHWTDNSDTAFVLWSRGGTLYGCVTDLRTGGVDRSGRPARARGFVIAEDDAVETALLQVARLITAGLPDGYIVPDTASPTGFTVASRALPRARFRSGGRVWPSPDRQQWVPSVEEAGRWLVALADKGIRGLNDASLAIGSPLLNEETADWAKEYALAAGPGLSLEEVWRSPKASPPPDRRRAVAPVAMLLMAILLGLMLAALILAR